MFRIKKIKNEYKQDIEVSLNEGMPDNNYYSIITGENGCGKSSLLSKAANNFIFRYADKTEACQVLDKSSSEPTRVIAICNARYSKFARMMQVQRKNSYVSPNYYIHAEHDIDVGNSLLSIVGSILREKNVINRHIYDKSGFDRAFRTIGVNPVFIIGLKFDKHLANSYEQYIKSGFDLKKISNISDIDNINHLVEWDKISLENELSPAELMLYLKRNAKFIDSTCRVEFSAIDGNVELQAGIELDRKIILSGIKRGFLVPKDLKIQRIDSIKWVSYQDLSSGQQSLLINALIISTFAKKDALICIDEPENSLHPEWQLNYMSFLNDLCPPKTGCHFLIATHSPQIISGLTNDNGCIVSLLKNDYFDKVHFKKNRRSEIGFISIRQELHSASSYVRRSADTQLVNVFNSPGYANESIIHRLILILTKITKEVVISDQDVDYLDDINEFIKRGRIDQYDPAAIIYNQIKSITMIGLKK